MASQHHQSHQDSFHFIAGINTIRNEMIHTHETNPSFIKVTTITITSKFGQDIDVPAIREYFNRNTTLSLSTRGKRPVVWTLSNSEFFNQVSIYKEDHKSTKSVKLFPNGSIHVAGCSDLIDCSRVLKEVSFIVNHITKKRVVASDYTVHMINSNFSLNYSVVLDTIFEIFLCSGYESTFNPDRYSAVKIKISPFDDPKRSVTASVFGSGKVIVTGAKNLAEVSMSYRKLMNVIFSNKSSLYAPTETVEYFDKWRGLRIAEWVKKISQLHTIKQNV